MVFTIHWLYREWYFDFILESLATSSQQLAESLRLLQKVLTKMLDVGHISVHSGSCPSYHIPLKRKGCCETYSQRRDINQNFKNYLSQITALTFTYIYKGSYSKCSNSKVLKSNLLKTRYLSCNIELKRSYNRRSKLKSSPKLHLCSNNLLKTCSKQKNYSVYNTLLITVTFVAVLFAFVTDSVSASTSSILDLSIERGRHTTTLVEKVLSHRQHRSVHSLQYPNCSEDDDCPEDQVCKFKNLQNAVGRQIVVLNAAVVSYLFF